MFAHQQHRFVIGSEGLVKRGGEQADLKPGRAEERLLGERDALQGEEFLGIRRLIEIDKIRFEAGDFVKLKAVLEANKAAGVELLSVNLDNKPEEAKAFLAGKDLPGTHLYQAGGLEGKLATDYGITMLPNLFVVGKDGKVVNRSGQIANVEEDLKKLLK